MYHKLWPPWHRFLQTFWLLVLPCFSNTVNTHTASSSRPQVRVVAPSIDPCLTFEYANMCILYSASTGQSGQNAIVAVFDNTCALKGAMTNVVLSKQNNFTSMLPAPIVYQIPLQGYGISFTYNDKSWHAQDEDCHMYQQNDFAVCRVSFDCSWGG